LVAVLTLVHQIQCHLRNRSRSLRKARNISVNQLLLNILHANFGETQEEGPPFHDLDHIFGRWTEEKFQRIQEKIDEERRIDPDLRA
jgi:hypothetical protein